MRPLVAILLCLCVALGCDKKSPPAARDADAASARVDVDTAPGGVPLEPRPLIDAHTHLGGLAYAGFLKVMEENNIVRAVNMSGGSTADRRRDSLENAPPSAGKIALFHNLDWQGIEEPGWAEREVAAMEESARLGFAGLKISKALGLGVQVDGDLVPVDDKRLAPIWEAAGRLGFPVAIHTGDPKAFFEAPTPDNERYAELSAAPGWSFYGDQFPSREELLEQRDRMVAAHPDTTFVLLHFANNPEDVDYVDEVLRKFPNAYVDIAARIGEIGRHAPKKVRALFERHQDRILFATDIQLAIFPTPNRSLTYRLTLGSISKERATLDDIGPFYAKHREYFETSGDPIDHPVPIQGEWKVQPVDLPEEILQKLYWKNAERLIFAPWLARQRAAAIVSRVNPETSP